jgi:RNA polymerase sigma-70 factor (ECF subfamily)
MKMSEPDSAVGIFSCSRDCSPARGGNDQSGFACREKPILTESSSLRTRVSLLLRLRQTPQDQDAWGEFVDRYGWQIQAWCRRWGLQEADAEDVTQTVLLQLATRLQAFTYDPTQRFRGWLKTLTHHAWSDFLSTRRPVLTGSADSDIEYLLSTAQARDDLTQRLQEAFDQELLELASARVRERVEPHTWEAYRLTTLEGLSGAEAAARLGMQVGTVFKARSKIHKMLQEVVRELDGENPG